MAPERTTERNVHFLYDTDLVEVTHFLYIFFLLLLHLAHVSKSFLCRLLIHITFHIHFFVVSLFFFCTIKVNVNKVALKLENERFWLAQSKTREEHVVAMKSVCLWRAGAVEEEEEAEYTRNVCSRIKCDARAKK